MHACRRPRAMQRHKTQRVPGAGEAVHRWGASLTGLKQPLPMQHTQYMHARLCACNPQGLRPNSIILMGKNTMMKRSIRLYCETTGNEKWSILLEQLVGNVGIVFTTSDLNEVKAEIDKYKVGAPARVGLVAPNDVSIPSGPTGMDPSQTSFFQVRLQELGATMGCRLHHSLSRGVRGGSSTMSLQGAPKIWSFP